MTSQNATKVPSGQGPRVPTGEGPRPTTLSGSSGEVSDDELPRNRRTPLFAALGALVVLGAGGGLMMKQKADRAAVEKAAAIAAAVAQQATVEKAKEPETVKITITSDPAGARVFRAPNVDKSIGSTPLTFDAKRGDDFDVLLKLDGYRPETRSVSASHTAIVPVLLTHIAPTGPGLGTPQMVKKEEPKKKAGGTKRKTGGADRDDVMTPNF